MAWLCDCAFKSQIELPMKSAQHADNLRAVKIATKARYTSGAPIPEELIPTRFQHSYSDSVLAPPTEGAFSVAGFFGCTGACADVIRQFDLGTGALVPAKFFQFDDTTPIPGSYFVLNPGARKDAFLPKKSKCVVQDVSYNDRWEPDDPHDGDIAVSSVADEGADLWIDPRVWRRFFISDSLAAALTEAGFEHNFFMTRCRVV